MVASVRACGPLALLLISAQAFLSSKPASTSLQVSTRVYGGIDELYTAEEQDPERRKLILVRVMTEETLGLVGKMTGSLFLVIMMFCSKAEALVCSYHATGRLFVPLLLRIQASVGGLDDRGGPITAVACVDLIRLQVRLGLWNVKKRPQPNKLDEAIWGRWTLEVRHDGVFQEHRSVGVVLTWICFLVLWCAGRRRASTGRASRS